MQIADRDAVAPVKAAQDAAWRATGRAEVRTYPIGHFDIYTGHPFEQAIADQLHFLRRHVGEPVARADRRSAAVASAPPDGRVQVAEPLLATLTFISLDGGLTGGWERGDLDLAAHRV